jgi:hypothetical protein
MAQRVASKPRLAEPLLLFLVVKFIGADLGIMMVDQVRRWFP